jgi:hypothetical protein
MIVKQPDDYTTGKHVQLLPTTSRAPKLWKTQALSNSTCSTQHWRLSSTMLRVATSGQVRSFAERVTEHADKLRNAIFVDLVSVTLCVSWS